MAVLFTTRWKKDTKRWLDAIDGALPDFQVFNGADDDVVVDWDAIEYALVWQPPPGMLHQCKNLKAVFNLGAGVDYVLEYSDLPTNVPLVRLVDPCLTEGMIEYVTHWVLHLHRGFGRYRGYQDEPKWRPHWYPRTKDRRVGILGLGALGGAAARQLTSLGFDVAGWSRSPKTIDGVTSFAGDDQLEAFLQRTEILVCLLPLTPTTTGILNTKTLSQLPEGAQVINVARGGHVVDDDLIKVLDSDHLAGAVLDVFHEEPLPLEHPFWQNPKVTITPHVASLTNPETACGEIAKDIKLMQVGQSARYVVDRVVGY
jgi:glyoxylate/hydroxypyruvate reductase A